MQPGGKARRRRPAHLQVVIMSIKKPIKHYLQFSDFTLEEYEYVIERAHLIKRKFKKLRNLPSTDRPHPGDGL